MNQYEKELLNNLNILQANMQLSKADRDYVEKGLKYLAEKLEELGKQKEKKDE